MEKAKLRYIFVTLLILLLLVSTTLVIYWPGLCGPFLMDDFYNLEPLGFKGGVSSFDQLIRFISSNGSGVTGRPVAMLSFLLDDQSWPSVSCDFKQTNLMFHLICGLLVFLLVIRMSSMMDILPKRSVLIAGITAAIWLIHPLNVSTTLYVIQRMTQLMTLFLLMGLISYAIGRSKLETREKTGLALMSLSLAFFGMLSFLSKENGALILFYLLVIRYTAFGKYKTSSVERVWNILFIVTPILALISYFILKWDTFEYGYQGRNFNLPERLLTESRILIDYLYQIFLPRTQGMGLIHENIKLSTSLISPISTLFSVFTILILLVTAWRYRSNHPVYSMAVGWFFCGHLLESTFIPAELYFEHRNYLPMIGPIFAGVYYFFIVLDLIKEASVRGFAKISLCTYLLLCAFSTWQLSTIWASPALLFAIWSVENPTSSRAQRAYASYLANNHEPGGAVKVLVAAEVHNPTDLSLPLNIINIGCENQISVPYDLDYILSATDSAVFSDGLLPQLESITKSVVQSGCPTSELDNLHVLLQKIEEIPSVQANTGYIARIYFLHADLYITEKKLNEAMTLLEKAYNVQPTVDIALKRAVLLGSAGLYQEALDFLDLAKAEDRQRRFLKPSRMDELDELTKVFRLNLKYSSGSTALDQ